MNFFGDNMSPQEERNTIINKLPIYRGLTLLLGLVIACGIILGATLANSAKDLLAGTGLGSFLGARANEEASLGTFVIAAIIFGLILYCRYLYFVSKDKSLMPVI
jgi:hypothetical protein